MQNGKKKDLLLEQGLVGMRVHHINMVRELG